MLRIMGHALLWGSLLLGELLPFAQAEVPVKPKVRAITAFVRIGRADYLSRIDEALVVLRAARGEFERQGYQVETLRVVTQPLGELVQGQSDDEALAFLNELDALAAKEQFSANVGPAMLSDSDDPRGMRLLARALVSLNNISASAIIAAADGIHWRVVRESAVLVRQLSVGSQHSQATFRFAASALLGPYGPFFPGAYHTGAGGQFSVGFEGAGVVQEVFARTHGDFNSSVTELTRQLTLHAGKAHQIGEAIAVSHGWTFAGVDPTPAPMGDLSIGAAMEAYSGARFGSSGTMTAALAITTAVKAVPVRQVGYAGLMVPVMEDKLLAQRWAEGTFDVDALLAYSAVCGTGLDTVPLPGDVTVDQLTRMLGDVASLAWKWHKPLSARLQPVQGKRAGDRTDFADPRLFDTTLHTLRQ